MKKLSLILPLFAAACAMDQPVNVSVKGDVSCKAFKYLSWSKKDTPKTIDGVRRHNAAYYRICKA